MSADENVMHYATGLTASLHVWIATGPGDGSFGAPKQVSELGIGAQSIPSWLSPDGCRLYLHANVAGPYRIYVATQE